MSTTMSEEELNRLELLNTGTSPTKNEIFDKNGYLIIRHLYDAKELYRPVPKERGQISYWGKKEDQFVFSENEAQVPGSLACYYHPQYRIIHSTIRKKLEAIIGCQLYNTYYYDRFYFSDQELTKHVDRNACEISVSIHISSNLKNPWPFMIKTPSGDEHSLNLIPGDGILYKGCERPHWREKMPSNPTKFGLNLFGKKKDNDLYYHQVFFHYVLANGIRSHFANDMSR